ncbi:hypothetical protein GTV32_14350 [Gordonia sp. SID5947]|uniref:hypothetical protein n=1 Tax=Gordonia sp. SID5947 TaxID=2690315 RepID=UPI00136F09BC|nr:hypothetical protein [Gordonia sp. SID5947]MYR07414.1 hypothetical protein [Gordonia sp. SID5947]
MSSSSRRISLAVLVGFTGIALAACGGEQEATSSSSETTATTISENPNASVVGGPKPVSPTTSVADDHAGHTQCGVTKGPDGSLRIVVLQGDLTCDTAKQVATEYSPKIATGQPQQVSGWQCGPSETAGILASCTKGDQEFGLAP